MTVYRDFAATSFWRSTKVYWAPCQDPLPQTLLGAASGASEVPNLGSRTHQVAKF